MLCCHLVYSHRAKQHNYNSYWTVINFIRIGRCVKTLDIDIFMTWRVSQKEKALYAVFKIRCFLRWCWVSYNQDTEQIVKTAAAVILGWEEAARHSGFPTRPSCMQRPFCQLKCPLCIVLTYKTSSSNSPIYILHRKICTAKKKRKGLVLKHGFETWTCLLFAFWNLYLQTIDPPVHFLDPLVPKLGVTGVCRSLPSLNSVTAVYHLDITGCICLYIVVCVRPLLLKHSLSWLNIPQRTTWDGQNRCSSKKFHL